MHLNDQTICARSHRSLCHRCHELSSACTMTRIGNNREMAQLLQDWDGRQIQRIASVRFESTNTTLTEHNVRISPSKDVFCCIQEFVVSRTEATFQ
ncbi:hypothetical protein D1872_288960 [compost metagenome]